MATKLLRDIVYVSDLLKHLGNVSAARVRIRPFLGTATERDVLRLERLEGRPFELVDGVVVEKPLDFPESRVAKKTFAAINTFLAKREMASALIESGMTRLRTGLIRISDICLYLPTRDGDLEFPGADDPISRVSPTLAVEVVSKANTRQEIARKLQEYFLAGTRLAWVIEPRARQAKAYNGSDEFTLIGESGKLDGGDVLPGFHLPLRPLFALLPPKQPAKRRGQRKPA